MYLTTPMKFYKRLGIYKANNCVFDPKSMRATSYRWWVMLDKIGNKVIFNNYRYSSSTSKHQSKLRGVLRALKIKIDSEIEAPKGLQDLAHSVSYYEQRITDLANQINSPRTRADKNKQRAEEIRSCQAKVKLLKQLLKKRGPNHGT